MQQPIVATPAGRSYHIPAMPSPLFNNCLQHGSCDLLNPCSCASSWQTHEQFQQLREVDCPKSGRRIPTRHGFKSFSSTIRIGTVCYIIEDVRVYKFTTQSLHSERTRVLLCRLTLIEDRVDETHRAFTCDRPLLIDER